MPLYEYICLDCGQPFEKMLRFSEVDQIPGCPTCAGTNTKKQISMFASSMSATSTGNNSSAACGSGGGGRFR